jgi:hypothetical protein
MQLIINAEGTVRFVYSEMLDCRSLGEVSVRRVSSVEPDLRGRWWADLSTVAGPTLGPFAWRADALAAEAAWLDRHMATICIPEPERKTMDAIIWIIVVVLLLILACWADIRCAGGATAQPQESQVPHAIHNGCNADGGSNGAAVLDAGNPPTTGGKSKPDPDSGTGAPIGGSGDGEGHNR